MKTSRFIRYIVVLFSVIIVFLQSCNNDDEVPEAIPVSPSGLEVNDKSATTINLSWEDHSDNELGFKIERSIGTSSTFTEQGKVGPNITTYTSDSLTPNTQYTYRVRAYNTIGDSGYSNTAALVTDDIAPLPPTELVAEAVSTSEINLTWKDNSDNETGFIIERATGSSTTFTELAVVGPNVITYSNDSLAPGTQYTYRLRAYNTIGDSGYSNTATSVSNDTAPFPPTELLAAAISSSEIALIWKDNSDNELGFNIERAEGNSTNFTSHALVSEGFTAYNDISLVPGTQYRYRVLAFNSSGDSDYTNTAVAVTRNNAPTAPTELEAVAVSSSQINLSWKDNSDNESGFKVERATGSSTNFEEIANVGEGISQFSNTGLASNINYTYRVMAYNDGGNSTYSNSVSTVTNGTPVPPSALSATAVSTSQINLNWIDNSDTETGFKIERATGTSTIFNKIATIVAGSETYSDIGLEPNTQYNYRLKAFNNSGDSDYSNIVSSTTLQPSEITVYATEDNSLIYNSVDRSWGSRVFNSGKLNLGCNFIRIPANVQIWCASAAIKFGTLQNQINGKNIKKATLRLYISHLPEDVGTTYAVNAFSSAWSTNSITFGDHPDFYASPQTNIEPPVTSAIPYDIDVTSIVLNWAEGRPNHGLLLRELESNLPSSTVYRLTLFESLEDNSGSGRRPQIIVEFQ